MLLHRLWCWSNIKPTEGQRLVFHGNTADRDRFGVKRRCLWRNLWRTRDWRVYYSGTGRADPDLWRLIGRAPELDQSDAKGLGHPDVNFRFLLGGCRPRSLTGLARAITPLQLLHHLSPITMLSGAIDLVNMPSAELFLAIALSFETGVKYRFTIFKICCLQETT